MNHADECFAGVPQEFLVCITVHKAVNTGVFTGELFVKITLDKNTKNTRTFANSENPFFNEYFVFEFHCTLVELLRLTVLFELKKYQLCKKNITMGELLVDLHSVWNQPSHSYFKKWGRLELPIGEEPKDDVPRISNAHIQIDLTIVSQHSPLRSELIENVSLDNNWMAPRDFDDIQANLLHDMEPNSQCNIRYSFRVFRGIFAKKSNYIIQMSFAGFKAKTPVIKHTTAPEWNLEMSFAWVYPSLAQRFLIQVMQQEHLQWKCVAEVDLSIEDMAFKEVPSLGPTYLHLYDPVNPLNYVGRILLELHSQLLSAEYPSHVLKTTPIDALQDTVNTQDENFWVEFLPLLGNNIHTSSTHYKFVVSLTERSSNEVTGSLRTPMGKLHSGKHLKYFRQDTPYSSCLFKLRLPDNRNKFVSDFYINEIIQFMRSELDNFKIFQMKYPREMRNQGKCLRCILGNLRAKIQEGFSRNHFDHNLEENATKWDQNRQQFQLAYFQRVNLDIGTLRQRIKDSVPEHLDATIMDIVNELNRLIGEISSMSNSWRVQDDWPTLLITLSAGSKILGHCRLNAKHFLFIQKLHKYHSTNQCWQVKSFVFKDLGCVHTCGNCGCNAAVVLGCLSIILDRERREFLSSIAADWSSEENMTWTPNVERTRLSCEVYIHQAKVRPSAENRPVCDSHVTVAFGEHAAQTATAPATLSPIWNAVITFPMLFLPGSISWYQQNPPLLSVEFHASESEFAGHGQLTVSVISAKLDEDAAWGTGHIGWQKSPLSKLHELKTVSPPPLKWVLLARNGIVLAEVLMSAEFKEVLGEVTEKSDELTIGIPTNIRPNMQNYVLEVIFVGLRKYTKSTFGSVGKRRAKIMLADLVLSSGLSHSRVGNSINYLVAYASGVVSLPDQQEYWPGIVATDVLLNSLTKETTLGAALVPNSTSFLQKRKRKRCHFEETSMEPSMITVNYDEEAALTNDSEDEVVSIPYSCWTRIKIALGMKVSTCANRLALKYDEHAEWSDLHGDARFTWWTKFYNSMHENQADRTHLCKHRLVIFPNELELQPQFGFLQDWAVPVPLVHGVRLRRQGPPMEDIYATLKLKITLTPCKCSAPDDGACGDGLRPTIATSNLRKQTQIKSLTDTVNIVVRIYIVQGMHLRPRDWSSESDCYVKIALGGKVLSDRAHYIPNQSNPIFGRFFELDAMLPADPMLEVILYDYDKRKDEIIGSTAIDLEDRWQSRHRARVGIPQEYSQVGYNQWHDMQLPSEILENLCQQAGIQSPYFYGNVIEVDGVIFVDETVLAKTEEPHERLCLTALRNLDKLPSFGYKLVPEHVETRSLYHPSFPGVCQGKLQLWIELFKSDLFIPNHIDITPTPPIGYEVRVVVKTLRGVPFGDRNLFGKLMSDIYVTGWCQDVNRRQTTDIHFRSFAGEALFNWRMIFNLKYSPNEDMMVIRRKGGLFEEIEIKTPPIIYLQVWDKDFITRDEYLGAIELNLSNLSEPYLSDRNCQPFSSKRKRLNLFTRRSIKGWFPLRNAPDKLAGKSSSHEGKIQLLLDICTETEASNSPAGVGHDPPMALERPNRPKTSFNPLTHPFKSFSMILWPAIRKYVYLGLFIILVGLGLLVFFSDLPTRLLAIPLNYYQRTPFA